jgi:hypothetical protein
MKQTAVEWFIEQLTKNPLPQTKDEFIDGDLVDIINKAKEMEAEQMGWNNKHPQTEISDEEILLGAAKDKFNADVDISVGSFELGARWYRERLKSKQ